MSESEESGGDLDRVNPWDDPELLREKYRDEKMSMNDIADELGCAPNTIRSRLKKFDIPIRSISEAQQIVHGTDNQVPMHVKQTGAVRWNYSHQSKSHTIFVHRLLAVAEWGLDAVRGHVVHHKNEIRWDNRPDNLELMRHSEHSSHHKKLNYHDRLRIVEMYREGASGYTLSPIFSVTPSAIINAVRDFAPDIVRSHGGWAKGGGAA